MRVVTPGTKRGNVYEGKWKCFRCHTIVEDVGVVDAMCGPNLARRCVCRTIYDEQTGEYHQITLSCPICETTACFGKEEN